MLKTISKTLVIALIVGIGIASHASKSNTNKTITSIEVKFPTNHIYPPTADLKIKLPAIDFAQIEYPRKDITLVFNARDKEHVKSSDPKLFNQGNMEIIDLAFFTGNDYSFPLAGAKVISPYAGSRKNHSGIDLKTCANDTIVAAFEGVVRMAKSYAAYGNVIVVRHFNGLETVYSHNSKNLVKPGQHVKAGEAIALTGRTGRATTDHLHFETRINGQHFNPELIFNFNTNELQSKSLLCTKLKNKINIQPIDMFPHQLMTEYTLQYEAYHFTDISHFS